MQAAEAQTMRILFCVLAGMLALVTVPGIASATLTHDECGQSDKSVNVGLVATVEIWRFGCVGVVVWSPNLVVCADNVHEHLSGVHVLALHDGGCQTGVIVGAQP